jgi:transcriptional regulator with XRE-family HTH domain
MAIVDKTAVGKRLKAIRLASGIERKEFVTRLGVGFADWNNYEDARMLVPPLSAGKLVDLVPGLTLDWIYLGRPGGLDADLHGKLVAAQDGAGKAA